MFFMKKSEENGSINEEPPERELTPSERSILLYTYLADGRELRKESRKRPRSTYYRDWKKHHFPEAREIVADYAKRDVEEVLFRRLNGFYVEGINEPKFVDPEEGPITQRELDLNHPEIEYEWAYSESFERIKEFQRIITRRKFLKGKGLSKEEIKGYDDEFREIVLDVVFSPATGYLRTPESMKIMGDMLNYCKCNGLITKGDYLSLIAEGNYNSNNFLDYCKESGLLTTEDYRKLKLNFEIISKSDKYRTEKKAGTSIPEPIIL